MVDAWNNSAQSAPDIKKTLGLVSGTEDVESPQGEQRHPLAAKPHPFQAAAKVSVPSEVESEEKQKQIARIRAKIASHQKKIQRLEEELQRIMSGRQLVHSTSREDVLITSDTTMTATSSEGSMRKRTKIKLDKSWEIDPKQVMVEKVLGGTLRHLFPLASAARRQRYSCMCHLLYCCPYRHHTLHAAFLRVLSTLVQRVLLRKFSKGDTGDRKWPSKCSRIR